MLRSRVVLLKKEPKACLSQSKGIQGGHGDRIYEEHLYLTKSQIDIRECFLSHIYLLIIHYFGGSDIP